MSDTANNIKNGISNAANTVVDGIDRMGSDVRDGIGAVENGIENTFDMNDTYQIPTESTIDNTNTYTVVRTADNNNTTDSLNNNLWIWIIVAVVSIFIIGLVWYYGLQNTRRHDE